jgi:hypothetical protein
MREGCLSMGTSCIHSFMPQLWLTELLHILPLSKVGCALELGLVAESGEGWAMQGTALSVAKGKRRQRFIVG